MLTAVVLELMPEKDEVLPVSHGAMTHAAALDLFLRRDAALSRKLHEEDYGRPFTASTLYLSVTPGSRQAPVKAGKSIKWRITGLNDEVSSFLRKLTPGWGMRIGPCVFEAVGVTLSKFDHEDAGVDSYQEIVERWTRCPEAQLPSKFVFDFCSPTTFRHGTMTKPFPDPGVFWTGLMKGWNEWSSAFCPQLSLALSEDTLLSNWQGETRSVEMGSRRTIGCVGRFEFRALDRSPQLRRLMAMLADFSFYAGVGWQTTAGMGQVRWRCRPDNGNKDRNVVNPGQSG